MEITRIITKDATLAKVSKDKQVVNFSIAINDSYKPKGSTEIKQIVTKILKTPIKSLYLYSKLLCYYLNYYILEEPSVYFDSILGKLARSYPGTCSLEELAALIIPPYNVLKTFRENISLQRQYHAKLLDALILLDDQGDIVLNPAADKSSITLKGLIKINNTVFCN